MAVYRQTYAHESLTQSVNLNSWKCSHPSQLPHTSLSAPYGLVPLRTSLAPPTVYFQQLRFGLCHPCARQPGLSPVCAQCLPAQLGAYLGREPLNNTRLAAVEAVTILCRTLQLVDTGLHCWRPIDQPRDRHTQHKKLLCLLKIAVMS